MTKKNTCQDCGEPSHGARCRPCSNRLINAARVKPKPQCADCGCEISSGAQRCKPHAAAYYAFTNAKTPTAKRNAVAEALAPKPPRRFAQLDENNGCFVKRAGMPDMIWFQAFEREKLEDLSTKYGIEPVKVKLDRTQKIWRIELPVIGNLYEWSVRDLEVA